MRWLLILRGGGGDWTPTAIGETEVERVKTFKFPGSQICEDLILSNFYSGVVGSTITGSVSVWHGGCTAGQDGSPACQKDCTIHLWSSLPITTAPESSGDHQENLQHQRKHPPTTTVPFTLLPDATEVWKLGRKDSLTASIHRPSDSWTMQHPPLSPVLIHSHCKVNSHYTTLP